MIQIPCTNQINTISTNALS